jgi:hypothetical protein
VIAVSSIATVQELLCNGLANPPASLPCLEFLVDGLPKLHSGAAVLKSLIALSHFLISLSNHSA